jgi:hypothetical protein
MMERAGGSIGRRAVQFGRYSGQMRPNVVRFKRRILGRGLEESFDYGRDKTNVDQVR